jgi:hypothetical protein
LARLGDKPVSDNRLSAIFVSPILFGSEGGNLDAYRLETLLGEDFRGLVGDHLFSPVSDVTNIRPFLRISTGILHIFALLLNRRQAVGYSRTG